MLVAARPRARSRHSTAVALTAITASAFVALGAASCSSQADSAPSTTLTCPGPFCGTDAGSSGSLDAAPAEGSSFDGPAGATHSPLCGGGGCDPDWASACGEPASKGFDAGDDAAAIGEALACQVHRSPSGPRAACEPAGARAIGEACRTSRDCSAGLACVGPADAGSCRPYCCGDPEACPADAFCAVRPLAEDGSSPTPLLVPACVAADGCELLHRDACPPTLVCAIVRADGTTSCVSPGVGRRGDACPCAEGFACARSSNTCLELCHTGLGAAECPGGTCQGASGAFPPGFGVCVGGDGG